MKNNDTCHCGSGKKYKECCQEKHGINSPAPDLIKTVAPTPSERSQLVALYNAGKYIELESRAYSLIERYADSGFIWKLLGAALQAQGKDALPAMKKSVELLPDDADAYSNLGVVLKDFGQLDDAVACCRRALEIKPNFAEAHGNLGNALQDIGQLNDAVESYHLALEIKPDLANVHSNLGIALLGLGRFDDAVASHRRALEIKPDLAVAHSNLGNALRELGQLDDAAASYRRALEIKPDYADAHSNLLTLYNCDSSYTSSHCLAEARQYGRVVGSKVASQFVEWPCAKQPERLRVGLVSGDFRNHPVGFFLESFLARLDPGRIELIAYSTYHKEDKITARIKPYFSAWKLLFGKSDEAAARLIHGDNIHVLLDLSGHTVYNRLAIFAWKPAPVQASWLGYFATTGVAAMDYLIADPWTVPEKEEVNFTEKIWRLPETYLCLTPPDVDVRVAQLPALTDGHITFGCFNKLNKINDAVVALWARVLQAVPGSRLYLKTKQLGEDAVRRSVVNRFAAHDVDAGRLILEGAEPRPELLAAYNRVDIALDPFPYPGGTTSIEALWMGVPVLTLEGERFLSHIGESILQNAGLPEWIASNPDDYVARAVLHASDLQRLAVLRDGLRQQVLASPVFDAPRFARHFEAALRGMWTQWCNQQ